MKDLEEKCLRFVLCYYQKNKIDTQNALETFKNKHQIGERNKSVYVGWLVSAAVAAVFIGFFIYPQFWQRGEWITVSSGIYPVSYMLPDSSSVDLFPNSAIRYREDKQWFSHREVQMKGKIRFSVRHQASHPFLVEGPLAQVKVLGTTFIIDESRKDTAIVEVESGKVQFSAVGQSEAVVLTQNMKARLVNNQCRPQIVEQSLTGSFVFNNMPLCEVLEKLSRYYKVKLSADKVNKCLTASFEDKSLEEIITLIEKVLNVKIEKAK